MMESRSLGFLDLEADFLKLDWGDVFLLEGFVDRFHIFHGFGVVGDCLDFGGDLGKNAEDMFNQLGVSSHSQKSTR